MAEGHSPLSQFEIKTLVPMPNFMGYNIDFTNSSLWMVLAIVGIFLFMTLGMRGRALVPGRWQSLVELTYQFISDTVRDTVGSEGKAYFPFIFSLFMFILFANLLGMVPYSFTSTSHIIVTFALAAVVFVGLTLTAIVKHGPVAFITRFFPKGLPLPVALIMGPLIYVAELFSFLARPISLSIRLAANMMAGHVMLKVIAGFVIALGGMGGLASLGGIAPLTFMVVLGGFEIGVCILQAYIFTVLTCIYLGDVLHAH